MDDNLTQLAESLRKAASSERANSKWRTDTGNENRAAVCAGRAEAFDIAAERLEKILNPSPELDTSPALESLRAKFPIGSHVFIDPTVSDFAKYMHIEYEGGGVVEDYMVDDPRQEDCVVVTAFNGLPCIAFGVTYTRAEKS